MQRKVYICSNQQGNTLDLVKYVKKQGIDFDIFNDKNDNVKTYSKRIPNSRIFNATYAFEYNERKNYFRFCILGIVKNRLPCKDGDTVEDTVKKIQKRFDKLKYIERSWLRVYFGDTYHKKYLNRSDADVKNDVNSAIAEMKSFMETTEEKFYIFLEDNR